MPAARLAAVLDAGGRDSGAHALEGGAGRVELLEGVARANLPRERRQAFLAVFGRNTHVKDVRSLSFA